MRRTVRHRLSVGLSAALVTGLAVVAPTSAGAAAASLVFDDFEDGNSSDWTFFGGNAAGGGGGVLSDRPGEGDYYLSTGWGGNGTASGFYGGAAKNVDNAVQVTLPPEPVFNMWVLNQSDATVDQYTLEVTLREDTDGDGWTEGSEDSMRLDTTFTSAQFNNKWTLLSAPLSSFTNLNTGGNGALEGAIDEMVIVIAGVNGAEGSTVEVDFDAIAFTSGPTIIDDFENGLPSGTSNDGEPIGFSTFADDASTVAISTTADPPADERSSDALKMAVEVTAYAGYIHAFENAAVDKWVTQDWSTREGISFWMYGQNSGTDLFIDILDNRNPGSTKDDAERFTATFIDDFSGWQKLEFPFTDFTRKEIGNGAPNDGLGLFEVHGYAIGTLGTGGAKSFHFDDVSLYGIGEPPPLAVNFAQAITEIEEGTTGNVKVKLNRQWLDDDPEQVSINFATERSNATPGVDFEETSGTLTFEKGEDGEGPTELTFPVTTFDNSKFTGDKQIVIRLTDPVDVERGSLFQGSVLIKDNEKFDPKLLDDFEQGAYLWSSNGDVTISTPKVNDEAVLEVRTEEAGGIKVLGSTCKTRKQVIPVHLLSTRDFDATAVDHTSVRFGEAAETHTSGKDKYPTRHVDDVNGDGLDDLVFHFRASETGYDCGADIPLTWLRGVNHDFALGQDWRGTESLDFMFKGTGSGEEVTVTLKDNRAADPGPKGWRLAWADEFNEDAGTLPNPANWAYEIGDSTPDGKNGWGNEERQYYTDDPKNAQTDGDGNLVIKLDEADGSQECYYGPCEYESARLITQNKAEFAYGRVESRLKVPSGGDGLWPAFWSLGTDITYNPWPGAGEIDIMEYVSRVPNEIFGTIHGPGYSGGESFGGTYDFGAPVQGDFHTYAVEWEPNEIRWYVDDILYHQAVPADVPGPWVYDKPFFLLLNFAIGGNFGGNIDPANTYPQEYLVDYVRVYQGPDTAERFEATFIDDSSDWQQVKLPITEFTRSDFQPAGAPNDGLGLKDVWGYGFGLPHVPGADYQIDQVRRTPIPPPTELTVENLDDSGPGSLREALGLIAEDGVITFDDSLAGGTLTLTSGQLAIDRSVTVDGPSDPVTISGGGSSRVLQIAAGATVSMDDLVITEGAGAPQGGGILNNGSLALDRVVVAGNTQTAGGTANFEFGGGGIYNGGGSTLVLTDSTVSDNSSPNHPGGGIYGYFGSSITIERSTVSDNVSGDVAGGLRSLGNATVVNSTFSGNTSTKWHGGGIFHTDGTLTVTNSTFAGNVAPDGTASGIVVATFGAPANATLTNNVLEGNGGAFACAIEGGGAATITSGGYNVISDGSCNPIGSDLSNTDALLGPLADNGGPTLTHALQAGSPAIDAADDAAAPSTDQRGVARPQGPRSDAGSFELEP